MINYKQFDNECQKNEYNAHVKTCSGKEIKQVHDEEAVYPTHDWPTEVYQFLKLKVVLGVDGLVVRILQVAELVGAKVELEL